MSSSTINNVTAPDQFTDAAEWKGPAAGAFVVTVANFAIVAEIGVGDAGIQWTPSSDLGPLFLVPGVHTLPGGNALRFRNAVAGSAAQVSVRAAPGKQLEGGAYASLSGLRVDAAGNVTYDFDGHVHADGLDLTAGTTGAPPNDRKVRWLDALGRVIAQLFGYEADPNHGELDLQAIGPNGGIANLSLIAAHDPSGASLTANAGSSGQASQTRTIIRDDNASHFLQLPGAARFSELAIGVSTLHFAGSDASVERAIGHGLHGVPLLAVGWARAPALGRISVQESTAPDAGDIYLTGYQTAQVPVTIDQPIYWLAST